MTSPSRDHEENPPNPTSEPNDASGEANPTTEGETETGTEIVTKRVDQIIDYTPQVGLEFDTEIDAYEFYKFYGWKMGFNIRREYANKSKKTGEITSRKFTCSREGFKTLDKRTNHTKPAQPDTRTGCRARMVVHLKKSGKYEVVAFELEHNHPLIMCANPLQKKVENSEGSDNNKIATGPSAVIVEPSGEMVNNAWEEQKHQLRTMRQKAMKYGESSAIMDYFQAQSLEDPLFFYAVQLDSEERAANIFWADHKMIMDYSHFGDVIAFDIASRSDPGLRPFFSFVGFNHYGETVIFATGFMYDETLESFVWLFETFLQAMAGKKPRTIYTHQDPIISKAINLTMPETYHALCVWHIKQSAKKNLNHLFRGAELDFKKEFKACIFDYDEVMDFLTAWNAMIDKYNLRDRDNIWLQKLYEEKEKWARPYVKWVFSGGMRSTQLNDRLNSELKDYLKFESDIVSLLKQFERVINNRRYKELEGEFSARLKLPFFKIKAPVLSQASEIYTYMIFQLFQEEYEEFQSAYIVNRDESGPMREYVVGVLGKNGQYKVYGNPNEQSVSCSCRKFETHGFLCSHALKILDAMDIKHLPERYVLKRWSKYARDTTITDFNARVVQTDTTLEVSSRYRHLCPKYIRLVSRASECEETYRLLDSYFVELNKKVEEVLRRQTTIDASSLTESNVQISLSGLGGEMERSGLEGSGGSRGGKKRKNQKICKPQYKSAIEKGLHKRKKSGLDQPIGNSNNNNTSSAPYSVLDPPTPAGNVLFQGMEVPPSMSPVGATPQAYKAYKGIDLSNPLGPMNYSGLNPGFAPPLLRENIAFSTYQTQGSHNQE